MTLGAPLVLAGDESAASNQGVAIEAESTPPPVFVASHSASAEAPRYVSRKPGIVRDLISPRDSAGAWYRTGFGALAVVLGLMLGLFWCVKRWTPAAKINRGETIRILGRTAVGPRQCLVVVRFGRRLMLVGVSPDRLDALAEVTSPDELAELTAQLGGLAAATEPSFHELLSQEVTDFTASNDEAVAAPAFGRRTSLESGSPHGLRALLSRLCSLQAGKAD